MSKNEFYERKDVSNPCIHEKAFGGLVHWRLLANGFERNCLD